MDQPLLVTVAMILNHQKTLLIKRAREPFKDYWGFVGGYGAFSKFSDPSKAVKYEVQTDLRCEYEPTFFTYNYGIFNSIRTVSLFFFGPIKGIPEVTPKYVKEYRWLLLDEANRLDLAFDHNKILSKFIKDLNSKNIQN